MKQLEKAKMDLINNEHAIALYKDLLKDESEHYRNDEAFDFHVNQLVWHMNKHSKFEARYDRWKLIEKIVVNIKSLFNR